MTEPRWFRPPPELEGERDESHFRADVEQARRAAAGEEDPFLGSESGERLRMRLELSAARARRRRRFLALGAVAATAAFVALGITLWPRTISHGPGPVGVVPYQRDVGIKGSSSLEIWRRRGGRTAPVAEGAVLRAGDRLRFSFRTSRRHLIIVNAEAGGAVQPFYPYPAGESLAVTPGRKAELPGSIALDQSRGTERLVAVFTDEPLSFAAVRAAIETAYPADGGRRELAERRPLALPGDVISVRIEKGGVGR